MSITDSDNSELFRFHTSASTIWKQAASKTASVRMVLQVVLMWSFLCFLMYTVMCFKDLSSFSDLLHSDFCTAFLSVFFFKVQFCSKGLKRQSMQMLLRKCKGIKF